jgi:hypothetical protein
MEEQNSKGQTIFLSAIFGIIIAFVVILVPHLDNSDRRFMPVSNDGWYTGASRVQFGTYFCGFGSGHKIETNYMSVSDFSDAKADIISDSFEHGGLMLIVFLISTSIIAAFWIYSEDKEKFKEIK